MNNHIINEKPFRLGARKVVALEKRLGKHPVQIFAGELPSLEDVAIVLHAAATDMSEDAIYDFIDKWTESGKSLIELTAEIVEIYKVSGIIPKDFVEDPNV